jgi:hypothetical protein
VALLNLILIALAVLALVFQLVTPLILNIPAIAVILIAFLLAVVYFRRRRQKSRLPVFAGLNLVVQAVFLILSIAILFVITLPNESPEDSPAVVQGIRNILISRGWIAKPKLSTPPIVSGTAADAAKEQPTAADTSAVKITIEEVEKPANSEEAQKP